MSTACASTGPDDLSPGGGVDALTDEALAALLRLPAPLAARLRTHARAARRLDRLVRDRLGPVPAQAGAAARALLRLDAGGLRDLAMRAGAVCHAGAVLRLIDGAVLRGFLAETGAGTRDAALHWQGLCEPTSEPDGTPLAARVARDGWRCLDLWCDAQPGPVARRVRLTLPPDALLSLARGPGEAPSAGVRVVDALACDA